MSRNSNDDPLKLSISEGIILLRWSFTVMGAVMSALLVAASQANENMAFYLMTVTLFKLSLFLFLFLFGIAFAALVATFMGYSERVSRDRWVRVQRIKPRLGCLSYLIERARRLIGRLWSWSVFALAILIGVVLPAGLLHFGSNSLKSDLQLSRELQNLQVDAFENGLSQHVKKPVPENSPAE